MKQLRFEKMGQIVITLALCLIATPALAGIADSPLPVLVAGKKTIHVYSVPGVIDNGLGMGTFFACTSTDTAPMQVGIDVFGSFGGGPCNDAVGTSVTVAPGATVTFGTRTTVWIGVVDVGHCLNGSARILATSRKLACTAYVADAANAPPTTSWQLTIIKKTTQKGE
jgi:hypothetical protein